MGYDVHITRARDWSDNVGYEISAREWLDLVATDLELVPEPSNGDYFVIWRESANHPEAWFDWSSGNIYTKYPDKPTLRKMLQIAGRLNARVQGDDGEIYEQENTRDSIFGAFQDLLRRGRQTL